MIRDAAEGSGESAHAHGAAGAESRRPPEQDQTLELVLPDGNVPLGFVQDSELVFLVGRDRSARWPVELLREGGATLSVAGRTVRGTARLISDPLEKEAVLERFRRKYGTDRYARWYGNPARVLCVRLGAAAPVGEWRDRYQDWLASEFDNIADDYDRHILGNRINRLLRDRSLALLRKTFDGAPRLLEIGCGSGMETLPLLADGHEIFCVDISERMLDVVRQKARKEGVSERLRTARMSGAALPLLVKQLGPGEFDGAYSTYGAMNCEAELASIPPALHTLLRPGGRFVAGVYNRWCAAELLGYLITGRFGRAFGRAGSPVRVGSSRFCVDIYALTPSTFERTFTPWFAREWVAAAPALLPPSDLVAYVDRFQHHFDTLDRWDQALASRWPFRLLGDHFLMALRRTGTSDASP